MNADSTLPVATLYDDEHPKLIRYLKGRTGCRSRAEDLAQTAWLKVLVAARQGACDTRDPGGLRAFLYTVARHAFLDECTRKHGVARTTSMDPTDVAELAAERSPVDRPEDHVERAETDAAVRAAVARLPAEQRTVVVLWANETSAVRMAECSGAPVDTVHSRRKYAFARLRRELAPTFGPSPA